MNLVRAEWTKLTTTRVTPWLLAAAALMAGGFTALFTGFAGDPQGGLPAVDTAEYATLVAAIPANVNLIALVLGVIGMTAEYRHRTATPTFLLAPRRSQVVLAKLAALAVAGLVLAVTAIATVVLVATVYGSALGNGPSFAGDALGVLLRSGLSLVIYTVIGVGLGALLRNQIGAVVGGLAYLFVVEPVLRTVPATAGAYKWLPGGATEAMTATFAGPDLFGTTGGTLLLLGYGLVAAALGTVGTMRRDVV